MEKFIFKNSIGKQIEIAYSGNYLLDTYDGLTAAEVIPTTSRGYSQNGYTLISSNLGARTITIHFYIYGVISYKRHLKERMFNQIVAFFIGRRALNGRSVVCCPV